MTPMDHMSTGFPWPRLSITSGAANPNEPAIVVRTSSLQTSILALPKSARTRSEVGALVRYSRFSGLRSARSEHGQPSRLPFSFGQTRGNMAATCKRAMLTSMDDVLGVEIVDGAEHLLDGLRGILLCELALLADPVEQLAARRQLGDDVVLVLQQSCLVSPAGRGAHIYIYNRGATRPQRSPTHPRLEPVYKADNMGVVQLLEHVQLVVHHALIALDVLLQDDLDGHLARWAVGLANYAIGAGA